MAGADSTFFAAGGTLRHDAPSYVEREADRRLYEALSHGTFCYVLTSRQMGKSSLMVRAVHRLRKDGARVAVLDLTAIGQNLTPEQWYNGLISRAGQQLRLESELEDYWFEQKGLGPVQRFFSAIRNIALELIDKGTRVILFIDEIDAVRSLPFSTDEFFSAIRECYNRRVEDPEFERLTFCLLGVATPAELIRDARTTPFNIGQRVDLHDFNLEEASNFVTGLEKASVHDGTELLRRIFHWTHGHPYLTQRFLQAIVGKHDGDSAATVDRLCHELFLSVRARESDDNLLFVREKISRGTKDLAAVLALYGRIRSGVKVPDEENNPHIETLRLSGIIRVEDDLLTVRNRIYHEVFDENWIKTKQPRAGSETEESIGVLPFRDISKDQRNEYLSDGLTEELIHGLGKIPGLKVASRTSSFQFKDKIGDIRAIGSQLNVNFLLHGSIRDLADSLRISVELSNSENGFAIWSENFDYPAGDLLLAQEKIAASIVGKLKSGLAREKVPAAKRSAASLEAHNLYLKGRYHWNKRTQEGIKRSLNFFEAALGKDPTCAPAYAGKADAFNMLGTYNYLPPQDAYPRAKAAALEALQLDEQLAAARATLGCMKAVHDWDWAGAEQEFKRAIAVNPSYATAHQWFAINCLTPIGRHEEALAELALAHEVDPLSLSVNASIALALHYAGRNEESIAQCIQTIEIDENFWLVHLFHGLACLATAMPDKAVEAMQTAVRLSPEQSVAWAALVHAYGTWGKREEALEAEAQLEKLNQTTSVPASDYAMAALGLGRIDAALGYLEQAVEKRSFAVIYLRQDPRFRPLHKNARFTGLWNRLGL